MKKALLFYVDADFHSPKELSHRFAGILEELGCECTIYEGTDILGDSREIAKYDLFVPNVTMGTLPESAASRLAWAVADGAAVAGCHGGMCDSFRGDITWQFLTGGQWVSHPGGEVDYTVNIRPDSELLAGIDDFDIFTEQYYCLTDPAVKIHASTECAVRENPNCANGVIEVPVVYTKLWGKGRVFYNSIGDEDALFDKYPQLDEIMRRGLAWCLNM